MDRRLFLAGLVASVTASDAVLAASGKSVRKPSEPDGPLIILDPGHGGHDPGAISPGGLHESRVVLDIARAAAARLSDAGVRVKLTRTNDAFIDLDARIALAERLGANLFVSIHADSAPNRDARGMSGYVLSERASDALSSQLAETQNRGARKTKRDSEVSMILADLTARYARNTSLVARDTLIERAEKMIPVLEQPRRAANFAVLRSTSVPAVLIETGFLSNRKDEQVLASAGGRRKIARTLAEGIISLRDAGLFA